MSTLFTAIYDFLAARRTFTIVCVIAITTLLVWLASHICLSEDITGFLPQHERELYEVSKPQAVARVCRSSHIQCSDAELEHVTDIISDITGYQPSATYLAEYLSDNIPYLLTADDYAYMESRLCADSIREALRRDKEILHSGAGEFASGYIAADPACLYTRALQRVRERGIVMAFEDDPQTIERLRTVTDSLSRTMPQVSVTVFSPTEVAKTNAECIKHDSKVALTLSAVIILILLISYYKSVKPLLFISLSVFSGGLFSLSVIYLIKGSVSAIAVGAGSIILGIAIDYSLHYVTHLKFNGSHRATVQELARPLSIGSLTTIAAFISLLFLNAEAMRDFGLFAALALIGTLFFVLVFMPHITPGTKPSPLSPPVFRHISTMRIEHSRAVIIVAAIVTLVLGVFSSDVKFDADMQHLTYMTPEQRSSLDSVMPYRLEDVQSRTEQWNRFWEARRDTVNALVRAEAESNGIDADMLTPYGSPVETSLVQRAMANLNHDFNYVLWVCAFVVFAFLLLSMRSAEAAVISFTPMTISWLWILGIMALAGIDFNIVNIVLATFIFGLGDDYAIFMMDGLMQENTYGSRMLEVDKNAVTLSAATLFAGIVTLITAQHPAMRSLASVTAIGMICVVLVTFITPPYLYRLLTQKKGVQRELPLTFEQILTSVLAFICYTVPAIFATLWAFVYFSVGKDTPEKRLKFHKMLQGYANFAIKNIPFTTFTLNNTTGETFDKPAIIVCNHQSMLDIMAILSLSPKIVMMTNDWVWNNIFFRRLIRYGEFYPASFGYDNNLPKVRSLVERGYSVVVFPEGTRTTDGALGSFRPGAFRMAKDLGLDILPLMIHGFWHVLPKTEMFMRKGSFYVEVMERIDIDSIKVENDISFRKTANMFRKTYSERYERLCAKLEDARFFIPYLRHKYALKCREVREIAYRQLSDANALEQLCHIAPDGGAVHFDDDGVGVKGWIYALTHPKVEVYARIGVENNLKAALNTACIPANLHFIS